MSRRSIVIFADADAFRIVTIGRAADGTVLDAPVATDASPQARAAALADALKAGGFAGANVLLLLPSTRCLCATISIDGLPTRQRGQALLYRFEERLPIAAEDIAADFVVGRQSALAVGVERRFLDPLVAAIREARVRLQVVCPASLLAMQTAVESGGVDTDDQWICRPGTAGTMELIRLADGRPAAWYVTSDDASDIALHVRGATGGATAKVTAFGVTPDLVERVKATGLAVEPINDVPDSDHAATESATAVLASRRLPWINLASSGADAQGARGAFAAMGMAGRVAVAAAILFAACLVCALFVRAARYERLAAGYEDEQREVYRQLFPDTPAPVDVRSRLRSEARLVAGDGGAARADANGLLVLRDVLTFLPIETRFRISELRLDGRGFTLEGDVPTHGDAEAVAGALRRRSGFDVQPPRTEQRGGVVAFTISGSAGKATLKPGGATVAALAEREASQ